MPKKGKGRERGFLSQIIILRLVFSETLSWQRGGLRGHAATVSVYLSLSKHEVDRPRTHTAEKASENSTAPISAPHGGESARSFSCKIVATIGPASEQADILRP